MKQMPGEENTVQENDLLVLTGAQQHTRCDRSVSTVPNTCTAGSGHQAPTLLLHSEPRASVPSARERALPCSMWENCAGHDIRAHRTRLHHFRRLLLESCDPLKADGLSTAALPRGK